MNGQLPLSFSLYVEESRIELANDATIAGDPELRADFDMANETLKALHEFIQQAEDKTDDQITILRLGIRIFNAAGSGLKVARAGYYHPAFAQIRDIIETSYLLDYFKEVPGSIQDWRTTNAEYSKYSPAAVRKALKKTDQILVPRGEIYSQFCQYATHPTPQGFVIISPGMMTQMGPFPDKDELQPF